MFMVFGLGSLLAGAVTCADLSRTSRCRINRPKLPGGVTRDNGSRRNVVKHDATHADQSMLTDADAVFQRCPGADIGALADADTPGNVDAAGDDA
jgi:hypothetical protein